MKAIFPHVAVIGLGLIGGSIALELKKRRLADKVWGVSRSLENRREALRRKAVDRVYPEPGPFLADADLIVVATPVKSILPLLRRIQPYLKRGALVTDVGSVKAAVVRPASRMGLSFLGGHPIAGTEQSGMKAAQLGLFRGRNWVLTPASRKDAKALARLRRWVEALGAKAVVMDALDHDRILSAVSHLPNVAAYALASAVASLKDPRTLRLAGSSLRGMTRVAESPPEMWRDVCLENRKALLDMLDRFEKELGRFRKAIRKGEGARLKKLFTQGRLFRLNLKEA